MQVYKRNRQRLPLNRELFPEIPSHVPTTVLPISHISSSMNPEASPSLYDEVPDSSLMFTAMDPPFVLSHSTPGPHHHRQKSKYQKATTSFSTPKPHPYEQFSTPSNTERYPEEMIDGTPVRGFFRHMTP